MIYASRLRYVRSLRLLDGGRPLAINRPATHVGGFQAQTDATSASNCQTPPLSLQLITRQIRHQSSRDFKKDFSNCAAGWEECQKQGPTGNRTQITRIRILCTNRYTIRPSCRRPVPCRPINGRVFSDLGENVLQRPSSCDETAVTKLKSFCGLLFICEPSLDAFQALGSEEHRSECGRVMKL